MGVPRKLSFFAVAASAALLLGACAPAGQEPPAPTQSQAPGETAAPAPSEPKTISAQLYQKPNNLDPIHALHAADQAAAAANFLPVLTFVDGQYVGRVAKSWDSPDNQHFTFVLNDVKWSDGTDLTAEDVAFSFLLYLHPDVASNWGSYVSSIDGAAALKAGEAKELTGVKVIDPKTLEVTLSSPNPNFLAFLTEIAVVPKSVYGEIAFDKLNGAPEFREPPIGSGAYVFSKWINDDTIEYVPNPHAFFPPKADKLILKFLTGDVAQAQLQTGEIDIAEVASTDVQAMADRGVTIVSHPGNKVMALHTSLPSGKLADKRVRQAIMYAIDRPAIIDSILAGKGRTADSMMFQPDWAQHPDQNDYAYNPDRARELLAEAKWDATTEVYLDVVPGQADRDAVFRIIVGQLQEVGMNAVIRNHQAADLTNYVNNFELDLLISPYTQTVPEPAALSARLTCAAKIPNGANITGFCNERVDELFDLGNRETDPAKRAEIYQELNLILNDELPNYPLYVADLNFGTSPTITGFDPRVFPPTAIADQWGK